MLVFVMFDDDNDDDVYLQNAFSTIEGLKVL